ncbi:SDR family NAD(P)-dependent oxidoreductase [Streptomyces sp. NBC_01716]|uniref:SDR family NAD(P)-dependent oxidoreductase n=1 Tax=Streptomyces sp. NBC_01716 TaxID=2975917 RepID=UPI002E36707E|nr:SDR family NAD(P)-dependent oxidoreductase [Streptomyces sp. NBC_01716]
MNEAGNEVDYDAAVAVIGMAGRFPGAGSVNQLWDNLRSGRSGLRTLTEEELADAGVGPAQLADPSYVRVAGPLEAAQEFDAGLFGFSRLEAEMMDPQHRVFLECSYEVLERAGYPPTRMPGRVGVFAGSGYPDYIRHVAPRLLAEPGGELMMATGLERDSFASLASYKLGLNGPSMTVQTFCSTSLVAVHLAVQSLLNFECEAAIAGGAFIPLPQGVGYVYQEGGILSPDGKVRTFDSGARGSVNGSGVTAVLLKRLSEAIDDGDHIDAVILGSAVNNDGRACAGFTAPGVDGQTAVMEQAISFAGVPAETIGYVECHGTGTQLGDSIELAALARAYPKVMERPVVLGSLKPSIGHLDRASGTAGLIRAAMALSHKVLPATPDYENPNPTLAAERGRFTVLTRDQPWPDERHPRRAGVSSFGLAGTNAHVVLEEPPTIERPAVRTPVAHLLVLSARDETALDQATRDLADCLETRSDLDLGDVAFTLQQSRTLFPLRRAFLCADLAEARTALADTGNWPAVEEISREPVAVLDPESALAAPDQWWEGLAEAIGKIVPAAPALATPDAARRGLLDALGRLGCRHGDDGRTPAADSAQEVLRPDAGQHPEAWFLGVLGRLWTAGADIDWTAVAREGRRRVPLPAYPFQRRRYWVGPVGDGLFGPPAEDTGRTDDLSRWTYVPAWRRRHAGPAETPGTDDTTGPWLVLASDRLGEELAERIRDGQGDVVVARPGDTFEGDAEHGFVFRPGDEEDAHRLIGGLPTPPRHVVHALAPGAGHSFDERLRHGFETVRVLVGALAAHAPSQALNLLAVTRGSVQIAGSPPQDAAQAALAALLPVLAQENPGWVCRHVDVGPAGNPAQLRRQADAVLAEVAAPHEGPVALRGTERWVRVHEPRPLPPTDRTGSPLRPGDVVLITGGLGHVGLILARHLTLVRGCAVVLTARTALPEPDTWKAYLAEAEDPSSKAYRYVKELSALTEAGADVLVVRADVADGPAMRAAVGAATERFGRLDLIVHGAGVSAPEAFGPAHMVDRAASASHFTAKVGGFHALREALDGRDVPVITLSSLSAVLGGLALGPYAAANAALDALALAERAEKDGRWLTVNWDTWRPEVQDPTHPGEFDMAPEYAVEVFERAVAAVDDVEHLVISTGSLGARYEQWVVRPDDGSGQEDDGVRDPRPDISTPYTPPKEGTERTLAEIWAGVLRLEEVGADDDFFRLGGNSVMAIQLIAQARDQLRVPVPVTALLGYPTVRGLASQIDGAVAGREA